MKKYLPQLATLPLVHPVSKVSGKYQIVIPRATRAKLGIKPGDFVTVWPNEKGEGVIRKRPKDMVDAVYGLGADMWESLGGADTYIEGERKSWDD